MPRFKDNEDDASINSDRSDDSHHSHSIVSSECTSGAQAHPSNKESFELSKRETRLVSFLRLSVIAVLIAAAVGVSVAVYRVTSSGERSSFESDFIGFSGKVIESFESNVENQLAALYAFGLILTSYAKATNATWPFVVLPDYERRAQSVLARASAISLTVNPIVTQVERARYEKFTAENFGWFNEGLEFQAEGGYRRKNNFSTNSSQTSSPKQQLGDRSLQDNTSSISVPDFSSGIADTLYRPGPNGYEVDRTDGPYFPLWMNAPALPGIFVENMNMVSLPEFTKGFEVAVQKKASLGLTFDMVAPNQFQEFSIGAFHKVLKVWDFFEGGTARNPAGYMFYPIFEDVEAASSKVVGVLIFFIHWRQLFDEILPASAKGIIVVLENTCNQTFTYRIDGRNVEYLGDGDRHDERYDELEQSFSLTDYFNEREGTYYAGVPLSDENCQYSVRVFPSQDTEDEYITSTPLLYTIGAILIFVCTSMIFLAYDLFVERRQRVVMRNALRSGAIVQSLFPDAIRDRLMQEDDEAKQKGKKYMSNNQKVKLFLNDDHRDEGLSGAKPIADLFPNTTVLFADIAIFTAWSSTRDPGQVFLLLQTIYQGFDKIARRRKVFKVETVGDCYVAATGLPDPQENHALIMARFAQDCLHKFNELTKGLEVSLGPDTGDLKIRFGLHSGPVTAGVLRGDKTRFQLFGDTVNSASRMESCGIPNRIQISKATADLLIKSDKESWVVPRQDEVRVKGKGIIKTYWLLPSHKYTRSQVSLVSNGTDSQHEAAPSSRKERRLIDWNVQVLSSHLRRVVARRNAMTATDKKSRSIAQSAQPDLSFVSNQQGSKTALDEVKEAIVLPKFDPKVAALEEDPESVTLDATAVAQLKSFVTCIASMYHANPFHNFEHASHVSMSVDKLLKRIVTPDLQADNLDQALHDYTHGITSDPLTHFGVVFSALIHDVDHRGVSNAQLGKEMPNLATVYKNKSIAEQNSIDLAWDLLMSPDFSDLRLCIYGNNREELARFRQIVINVVLATDIFDKELGDLRKGRWQKAFSEQREADSNLKATIVLEHLIQASDVSHTMQHWHVYRKWNERLFLELYQAYEAGRMGSDPSTFWAKGEIGFFDNYVIPLAKKLSECKVFGVSSDEYLNYAQDNRDEWAQKGPQIVAEMVQKYCQSGMESVVEEDDEMDVVPFE